MPRGFESYLCRLVNNYFDVILNICTIPKTGIAQKSFIPVDFLVPKASSFVFEAAKVMNNRNREDDQHRKVVRVPSLTVLLSHVWINTKSGKYSLGHAQYTMSCALDRSATEALGDSILKLVLGITVMLSCGRLGSNPITSKCSIFISVFV